MRFRCPPLTAATAFYIALLSCAVIAQSAKEASKADKGVPRLDLNTTNLSAKVRAHVINGHSKGHVQKGQSH